MTRMKSLARMYTWWPRMDEEVELMVQKCQENQREVPKAAVRPWKWPSRPWNRIHIDYAGPFMGAMFLVIVDAHTKWTEIVKVSNSNTSTTIDCLRNVFATFGYPNTIVSDNGTSFTSKQFQEYVKSIGALHVTTAPYHPQSNGLAERMVQTFKSSMKKLQGPLSERLTKFLMHYRTTPRVTPAELMLNRQLRTKFDLLYPMSNPPHQNQTKSPLTKHRQDRSFDKGDCVYVHNYSKESNAVWIPGKILQREGEVMYRVLLDGLNKVVRRHLNQMKSRVVDRIPELEITSITSTVQNSQFSARPPPDSPRVPRYPSRSRRPPPRYHEEEWNGRCDVTRY